MASYEPQDLAGVRLLKLRRENRIIDQKKKSFDHLAYLNIKIIGFKIHKIKKKKNWR